MSAKLLGWVWDLQLKRADREILLALADHADHDGYCQPGVPLLAWKTDYSERQVQRILRELEGSGLVEIVAADTGRGKVRRYRLRLDKGVRKSPFTRPERVTDGTAKGDNGGPERVTPTRARGREPTTEPSEPSGRRRSAASVAADSRAEITMLCQLLADLMVANGYSAAKLQGKPATDAWRDPIRLLLDGDGRTVEQVERAIRWSQRHEFYRAVILSPSNLREHYEAMRLRAQQRTPAQRAADEAGDGRRAATADSLRRDWPPDLLDGLAVTDPGSQLDQATGSYVLSTGETLPNPARARAWLEQRRRGGEAGAA